MMIDKTTAEEIRNRDRMIQDWMRAHKTNSYYPEELSKELGIALPTNDERSSVEVFDFVTNPPDKYFLYISEKTATATTWTGETLGRVSFGREFGDNFGGTRVPVTIFAINNRVYHGTYYKSAGDYARVKLAKAGRAS